jgi:hypothetical protein
LSSRYQATSALQAYSVHVTVLKLVWTSLNVTLPAFAATLKWHEVSVAILSYFYIIFGVYQ